MPTWPHPLLNLCERPILSKFAWPIREFIGRICHGSSTECLLSMLFLMYVCAVAWNWTLVTRQPLGGRLGMILLRETPHFASWQYYSEPNTIVRTEKFRYRYCMWSYS